MSGKNILRHPKYKRLFTGRKKSLRVSWLGIFIVCWRLFSIAQTSSTFNVYLQIDYTSAEQSIQLFEDQFVRTQALAELRGNRIAASTTGLIANRGAITRLLQSYLDSLRYHQRILDDVYNLDTARDNVAQIKELLSRIQKSNFNQRIVATVQQLFPQEDKPMNVTIPVYLVALGHDNVEAYVRRIVWNGDIPQFVGEGKGELTIVVNLAQSVRFHPNPDERFYSLMSTVAHEVFHAAFGAYKDRSSAWKEYYAAHTHPFDALMDLTQNEGIAYYLSLEEAGHGNLPRDWYARTRAVFKTFNRNGHELLSDRLSPQRASELLHDANLSGFWENYGAMTGMFMAREIDQKLGRTSLIETISEGPTDFFRKYDSLTQQDSNLPGFEEVIISEIRSK